MSEEYKRDELIRKSIKLLQEYGYDATEYGVGAVLDEWWENKGKRMVELFGKHPNYNGNYQIVFSIDLDREIDTAELYSFSRWMCDYSWGFEDDRRRVRGIVRRPSKFIDEVEAKFLNERFKKFGAREGQKRSRAVNKMCKIFGLDKLPEFNVNFARYADAINPLVITRHTVISFNPLDYWTMSFGNSWTSCHTIDKQNIRDRGGDTYEGMYSGGTESYMLDHTSIVFYTVDGKYNGTEFESQDKINRNMFHIGEECLLQGRVYPQGMDDCLDIYKTFREIMQKVLADCMGVPNLWVNRKGTEECHAVTETTGVHYRDYLSFDDCNVSYLNGKDRHTVTRIRIGHDPICPCCGEEHDERDCICCNSCRPESETCQCCGCVISDPDDVCWCNGEPYCRDCATWDEWEEEWTRDECEYVEGFGDVSVWNLQNNPDEFGYCEHCGRWYLAGRVNGQWVESTGNWYCGEECAESDGNVFCVDIEEYVPEDEAYQTGDEKWYSDEEAMREAGYTELMDDGAYYKKENVA